MKDLRKSLNQPLSWSFKKKKIQLFSGDQLLLELREENHNKASFELEGKKHIIRNEGFWNPKTVIENKGGRILDLKRRFLGNKGTIEFENGQTYLCKIRNSPLVKLSFFTNNEKEILFYKLDGSLKPRTILTILDHSIPADELLILIVLGCYSFKGIVQENDDSDLIVMVAAAAS